MKCLLRRTSHYNWPCPSWENATSMLDPITPAVIQNGLQPVCNEMDLAFARAAA
jgi:hypothetical protein